MNNDDKGYTIYCSRCGAEMNSNSRYCMKCGNLNSDHEANQSMKPYIKDNAEAYQVGSGILMGDTGVKTTIGNNTGNRKLCFIVNFSIYMFIMIISYLVTNGFSFDILKIRDSSFPIVSIIVSISFLYIYSIELIFMKINKPWWSGLIPVYNMMMLTNALYQNKWLGLITLVPVVGQIFTLVIFYTLGSRFKFNGLLTALLSFIFVPIIGFGNSLYQGRVVMDNLDPKDIEINYQRKKVFFFFIMLFILFGTGLLVWKNMDSVEKGGELLGNAYYVNAGEQIVNKTKEKIKKNKYECDDVSYDKNSGVYYFMYPDLGDYVTLLFYLQRDPIEGYVKVDNTSGSSKYYVSLTDGTKGFDEVLISELNNDKVVKYKKLRDVNRDYVCYVK